MDMKKLLSIFENKGDSMEKAANNPEGPKFKGYWAGKNPNPPKPGQGVGGGCEESAEPNMLKGLQKVSENKSLEWELAEAFANFNEDDLGVEEKRPSRKGARPSREYTSPDKPSKRYNTVKEDSSQELNVGDDVIITGPVEGQGETGVVTELGRDGRFVVVQLYNGGKHSFNASDVEFNDYAGSDAEEAEMYDRDPDARKWAHDLDEDNDNTYMGTVKNKQSGLEFKVYAAHPANREGERVSNLIYLVDPKTGKKVHKFTSSKEIEQYYDWTRFPGKFSEGIDDAAKDADYNTGHKKGCADARAGKPNNSKECISAQERKGYADGYKSLNEGWESGPEERSSHEPDPDWEYDQARQEKLDAPYAKKEPEAKGYQVVSLDTKQPVLDTVFATKGEAMAYIGQNYGKNLAYRAIYENRHTYTGPHGEMDVEKKGNVTTVRRKGWDSSHGSTTKVKGGKYFSNPNDKVPGPGIKTGSGISDTAGSSRKIPQYDLDYTDRDMDEGMSSYPTDTNWDKSGQMDPLTGGTGPSRTRTDPRSTKHDLDVANWQTKKAIKDRKAKGVHKKVHIPEGIESADPVEGAVLKAAQELIHQGHTDVAPEVITNMVVAATGKPFMLKDLVDANKKSPAIQHYIDSINPSKVKFSSDILTVKNENPAKAQAQSKERAQAGVSSMAARAANRSRLGESKTVPVISAFRRGMEKIAASNASNEEKQAAFDRLSAEFHKKASAYSNKIKGRMQIKEFGANQPQGTAAPGQGANPTNPQAQQAALQATNALKSATNTPTAAPQLAKAIDDASQGTATNAMDMKALAPTMNVVKAASQDPKIANQFKTLAQQAKNSQQTPTGTTPQQ